MNAEEMPGSTGGEGEYVPPELTEEAGMKALGEHLRLRAKAVRAKYEGRITAETILQVLADGDALRYPVELQFGSEWLDTGEFANPQACDSEDLSKGFVLFLHPFFQDKMGAWPALIAYHIPSINYGGMVTADEAELYGAALLGLEVDDYYDLVCELADALAEAVAGEDVGDSSAGD